MEQKTIWLVIENDKELIYKAFELYSDAIDFIESKKDEINRFNKCELIEIPYFDFKY
jgi:hypothetical protein